jgi:hypothetical protein
MLRAKQMPNNALQPVVIPLSDRYGGVILYRKLKEEGISFNDNRWNGDGMWGCVWGEGGRPVSSSKGYDALQMCWCAVFIFFILFFAIDSQLESEQLPGDRNGGVAKVVGPEQKYKRSRVAPQTCTSITEQQQRLEPALLAATQRGRTEAEGTRPILTPSFRHFLPPKVPLPSREACPTAGMLHCTKRGISVPTSRWDDKHKISVARTWRLRQLTWDGPN